MDFRPFEKCYALALKKYHALIFVLFPTLFPAFSNDDRKRAFPDMRSTKQEIIDEKLRRKLNCRDGSKKKNIIQKYQNIFKDDLN